MAVRIQRTVHPAPGTDETAAEVPTYQADRVAVFYSADGVVLDVFGASATDGSGDGVATPIARIAVAVDVAQALRGNLAGQLALGAAAAAPSSVNDDGGPAVEDAGDEEELLPPIRCLTPEESRAMFDVQARTLMGMSGEEFLRRYDAGEFDAVYDDPDHPEVLRLSMLIPFAR